MRGSAAFRAAVAPGGVLAGPWVRNELWRRARAVPSLDLRFADNKSLVDATTGQNLITFTRASSGTYVGSDGLIKTATTNLLLQSEDFATTWSTVNTSISTNAITSPTGQLTADKIIEDTDTGTHNVQQNVAVISGTFYTFSVYVKSAERSAIALRFSSASFGALVTASYNLTSQTATVVTSGTSTSASIIAVGDGWYRCSLTSQATASATTAKQILLENPAGTRSYTGDNTSGIYLWGAQLEQSTTVGEYIPTTSTINSAPRFDHNPTTGESLGLLVEESRTNSLVQSEDFSTTWTQSNVTVTTNTVTAPDGTTTADTFGPVVGDGLTTTRFLRQSPALTTQQAYTLSVFVKVGTATTNGIALYVADQTATNSFRANFNLFTLATTALSTGWATPTSTIIPYPNGWYRCILSGVTSTAHTSLRAIIYLNFFGTTADTYGTIHIWGAQLEAGAFPTSYIPTTTATVTRSADVASITGSNFSSWYRADEGTVFAGLRLPSFVAVAGITSIDDSTTSNRIQLRVNTLGAAASVVSSSGSIQANYSTSNALQVLQLSLAATSYKANDFSLCLNGGAIATDNAGSVPTVSQLVIGNNVGANPINGTIRRLTYWPARLPNETLQTITQ